MGACGSRPNCCAGGRLVLRKKKRTHRKERIVSKRRVSSNKLEGNVDSRAAADRSVQGSDPTSIFLHICINLVIFFLFLNSQINVNREVLNFYAL
jgi:hypothetical protein